MASFQDYEGGYNRNWADFQIRPNRENDAQRQARRLLQGKSTYKECESKTGVPWWFIGLCHYRESNYDFNTYLGNGQSLAQVTTIVPKGRGPFLGPNAFVDGAVDALRIQGFLGATDWGIARTLYRLEGFNGYGYHGKGVNSPYLYGGSTVYGPPEAEGGKYTSDHVFDPNVVDTQLGTAVILKELMDLDSSIQFDGTAQPPADTQKEPDDELAHSVLWVQQSLNKLGASPPLAEDGKNGPKTMAAVSRFQQTNGLQDTGLADAATIAAIQGKLQPMTTSPTVDVLMQRLQQLEKLVAAAKGGSAASGASIDLPGLLEQLMALAQNTQAQGTATTAPNSAQLADQLRRATDSLVTILADKSPPLGQVNGALGQTLGNFLDGKKTAIGLIGSLLTSELSQMPAGSGLGQIVTTLTPAVAAGLSPYAMPIFLALTAWGVLGKMEKWAQGTAPPPQPPK
jgi:lysozyme family protein/peptidoglycan hydrolase-like protein with peptidoglycan-binding domain